MTVETILAIASFALALGGLVPIFFLREQKKIVALIITVSALLVTTSVALFRVLQHEKIIIEVQAKFRMELSEKSKTLDQLDQDLPNHIEYADIVEALFRGLDKDSLGQKTIYFVRDGESIPVKVYFAKHPKVKSDEQ